MRNERGQALIEFLMIVPILFFIIMAVFDFGNILYQRYELENHLDVISDLYKEEDTSGLDEYLKKNGLVMDVNKENKYQVISVKRKVSIVTPGLGKILGSPIIMNNRGQTLVLFLFLFPVLFLLFMAVYQIGTIELEKRKMEEVVGTTVQYGIDHWGEEEIESKMIEMFQSSFSVPPENMKIVIEPGNVRMMVTKEYNILFFKKQTINVSYVGTNIDGKVQVVKE